MEKAKKQSSKSWPQLADVTAFRETLVERNPAIRQYLPQMAYESFFLLAATGLGKTVVMPVFALEYLLHNPTAERPQLWVVEPKVFIAQDQAKFLDGLWQEFCKARGIGYQPLFGCKTKVDTINVDAPIVFCTTGIFSIYARSGKYRPGIDGVLIDEAHDTLETDHAFELGVALCRRDGVRTDFMSATVDEKCIDTAFPGIKIVRAGEKRHAIWRHNTKLPMLDCIVDVVRDTLVRFNPRGAYAPPANHPAGRGVAEALTEKGRSRGLLVIVSSYAAEHSDGQQVIRKLKEAPFAREIEVALLAGETRRDPVKRRAFDAQLERWKKGSARYVVVATSVVEMGVTLPNLDVVVSTDVGVCETDDGGIETALIGANAMLQRAGRVGRQRPGLHVITCDSAVQGSYSRLDDAELNGPNALKPEAIRFPLRHGVPTCVAFVACEENLSLRSEQRWLDSLKLPSGLHRTPDGAMRLSEEIKRLREGGVATHAWNDGGPLTDEGKRASRWLGQVDPVAAVRILKAYVAGDTTEFLTAVAELGMVKVGAIVVALPKNDAETVKITLEAAEAIAARLLCIPPSLRSGNFMKSLQNLRLHDDAKLLGDSNVKQVQTFHDALAEIVELLSRSSADVHVSKLHLLIRKR